MVTMNFALQVAKSWLDNLAENGPDLRINAHKKAVHEARELAEDPSLEELADVAICLVGTLSDHGWTMEDWANAVLDKVGVNELRNWVQQSDGTWQHD